MMEEIFQVRLCRETQSMGALGHGGMGAWGLGGLGAGKLGGWEAGEKCTMLYVVCGMY